MFLQQYDSAQVDAYMFGLKIVVFNNSDELNMSPLTDNKDVIFVNTLKLFLTQHQILMILKFVLKNFFTVTKIRKMEHHTF